MSLKENVEFVKEELNSEEKFLESFVKVERVYKKYKILILGVVFIAILAAIGIFVKQNIDEKNKLQANIAFEKLLKDGNDKEALESLKNSNKNLYEIALYLQAKKEGKTTQINIPFLKELSTYQKALEDKNATELNNVSMQNDFLLKEFAIFNRALILANEGKFEEAKTALKLIPTNSKANDLANLLNHYLATK